jgi:tetratricopeptide (TPR) repeat protein
MINKLDNDALEGFQKALSIFSQPMFSPAYDIATTHFFIGYLYTKMEDKSLATNHFRLAIDSAVPNHPVRTIANEISSKIKQQTLDFIIADLLLIYTKIFEAEYVPHLYEKAIFYCQQYPTELSQVKLATICLRVGLAYQTAKNDNLAKKYLDDASAIVPPDSESIDESEKKIFLELAEAQFNYADYCMSKSDFDTALPLLKKSLHIYEMLIPLSNPKIIIIYRKLAGIYAARFNISLAIMCLEKVVANPVNQGMYEESKCDFQYKKNNKENVDTSILFMHTYKHPCSFQPNRIELFDDLIQFQSLVLTHVELKSCVLQRLLC